MATWDVTTKYLVQDDTHLLAEPSLTAIDSSHFLCSGEAATNGSDINAQIHIVNTTTWVVTTANPLAISASTSKNSGNSATLPVDTNHVLTIYPNNTTSIAQVLVVNTTTWAVTSPSSLTVLTNYQNFCLQKIDTNHFLTYQGRSYSTNCLGQVLTVNTTTWAVTTANTALTIGAGYSGSLAKVDTNHFLMTYANSGQALQAQVLTVDTTTWAVTTAAAALGLSTSYYTFNNLMAVDTNHFVAFRCPGNASPGNAYGQVLTVDTTTWAVTTSATEVTMQVSTTYGAQEPKTIMINSSHFLFICSTEVSNSGVTQSSVWARIWSIDTSTYVMTAVGTSAIQLVNASGAYFVNMSSLALSKIDTSHFLLKCSSNTSNAQAIVLEVDIGTGTITSSASFLYLMV